MNTQKIKVALLCIVLGFAAPSAISQNYPSKPVRLLVGFSVGGSTDIVARMVAQKLTERYGHAVIVENRPGGDSIIAAEAVAKASPDGHTLLFITFSTMTILPHTRKNLPYEPFKDFVHVAQIAYVPYALAMNPLVPAANIAELLALARAKPGQLTYAAGSEGGFITAEMFKAATGATIAHVPYKGSGPATTDLLSGQVNMMFSLIAGSVPYFKTQKLKALAVTGEARSPAVPEVPTMAESGLKGFESSSSFGISAPRGTPTASVKKLAGDLAAMIQPTEFAEKMLALGVEPRFRTPDQFTAILHAESEKYRGVLQRIGFKPE